MMHPSKGFMKHQSKAPAQRGVSQSTQVMGIVKHPRKVSIQRSLHETARQFVKHPTKGLCKASTFPATNIYPRHLL